MRIVVKGGAWRNTEDELLKALVMKYGKNQWDRISSLLSRKSAKQCKARWNEFLDPSIKKTEWSRAEDEKLLHLAKIFSTQWRTIAQCLPGRTAAQALKRYEQLLDAATAGADGGGADDPRKLRQGEIDPFPEARPAKPDPVDMDEDEKEMLAEARARLANTKGKKAKRKARERQLDEARRLAALQKNRELRAAGITPKEKKRNYTEVDYANEVAFELTAPKGYYEPTPGLEEAEAARKAAGFKPIRLQDLRGKTALERELEARKRDAEKAKAKAANSLPEALDALNKKAQVGRSKRRSTLMLPPAQVSDRDLSSLAKMAATGVAPTMDGNATPASSTLLNSYPVSATPALTGGVTPARGPGATPAAIATPLRTPSTSRNLMAEAQDLIALTRAESALKGGTNAKLHAATSGAWDKATPARGPMSSYTPNPYAAAAAATPALAGGPGATPLRDAMGINLSDPGRNLITGLASLPAPKGAYQATVPSAPAHRKPIKTNDQFVADARDEEAAMAAALEAEAAAREASRSAVIRRGLPRPTAVPSALPPLPAVDSNSNPDALRAHAAALVDREVAGLLSRDALDEPVPGVLPPSSRLELHDAPEDQWMSAAQDLLANEVEVVKAARGHTDVTLADEAAVWESRLAAQAAGRSKEELMVEYGLLEAGVRSSQAQAKKLGGRLTKLLGGYAARGDALSAQTSALSVALDTARLELETYRECAEREARAIIARERDLVEALEQAKFSEAALQREFAAMGQ